MDGVRGRMGKSLYLVIANLQPSIREQKFIFLFLLGNVSTREVVKEA